MQNITIFIVCRLKIAPPIIVGLWPMAVLLWQHIELLLFLIMDALVEGKCYLSNLLLNTSNFAVTLGNLLLATMSPATCCLVSVW